MADLFARALDHWDKLVTAIVAIYGAVLSTYNLVVTRRDKLRGVTVQLRFGFMPIGPDLGAQMLFIEASNPGHRPVQLTSVGLLLPDRRTIAWMQPQASRPLPAELSEGQSCSAWMPLEEVEQQLRRHGYKGKLKVRGFYDDALGKRHYSRAVKVTG